MENIKYLSDSELKNVQKKALLILQEIDRICRKNDIKYTIAYGTLLGAIRHGGFIPWDDDIDICMLADDYVKFREVCAEQLNSSFFYQTNETDKEYFRVFDKVRLNGTLFLESAHSNHNIHQGVYLDVFPVDNIPDNNTIRKKHLFLYSFFHLGVAVKYINIHSRTGKKRIQAAILRVLFCFMPLKWLYEKTISLSVKYNSITTKEVHNYDSTYGIKDIFPRYFYSDVEDIKFDGITIMATRHAKEMLTKIYGDYMKLPPIEKRKTQHDLVELII